jgi:hypothetical protein
MILVLVVQEIDEHKQEEYSILMELRLPEYDSRQVLHHEQFFEHVYVLQNDKNEEEDGGMDELMEDFLGKIVGAVS